MSSIASGLEAFEIAASDETLDDLSRRLRAARLSAADTNDWNAGTSPAYLRDLIAYWRDRFDWRAQERMLNRFPQFRAEVDGTRVHFIHQRGRGPRPLPLPADPRIPRLLLPVLQADPAPDRSLGPRG